jgi:plastocyanin
VTGVRRPRSPLTALTTAATIVALALTGCGDTSGDAAASDEAPAECGPGDGRTVTVEIAEFAFDPGTATIQACDSVVWANEDEQAHTATGDGDQRWNTGNLQPGEAGEPVRFESPGSYTYRCALHPFMTGTVEVS